MAVSNPFARLTCAAMMMQGQPRVVLLVDDVRRFRDGRACRVARTSAEAVALLLDHRGRRIDELWLDHDLLGNDNVWPVVHLLEDEALAGRAFDIGMVHVQASSAGRARPVPGPWRQGLLGPLLPGARKSSAALGGPPRARGGEGSP